MTDERPQPTHEIRENWDYYIAEVDGLPASIAVDLALDEHIEHLSADTLYVLKVGLLSPGADGTGTDDEAQMLHAAEKAIVFESWQRGLRYVGRVRNNGHWDISFMGQARLGLHLELIAESQLRLLGRTFVVKERPDPSWSFYRSFLFPDLEQLQWMKDRRVTDALQLHGDTLTTPRRIDHVVFFDDPRNRDAFRLHCEGLGFGSARGPGYSLQVFRTDSVRLEDVHSLSLHLSELAAEYTGQYRGWKTRLVRPTVQSPRQLFDKLGSSLTAVAASLRGLVGWAASAVRESLGWLRTSIRTRDVPLISERPSRYRV